ncbi:MAG: trigger factor [Beijerinckiaceae bacterium]
MQVTETLNQGLKREYKVSIPAETLAKRMDEEIESLKGKVQLKGFRPGKVPTGHLKRMYGRSVMGDVLQNAINEANKSIIDDKGLKLAMEPQVSLPEGQSDQEALFDGKANLNYDLKFEVLPQFEVKDFSGIEVVRETAEIPEDEVKTELERLAKQNLSYEPRDDKAKAKTDDRVIIDFVGSIDGVEFQGGKGTDVPLVLGSGMFIPGFEEQLVGTKKGDALTVKTTFPADYPKADLAGKEAAFAVTVKGVEAPGDLKLDDTLATAFGMEKLENLETAIRENIGKELGVVARARLKRRLLDKLDTEYQFDLPEGLVEQEFSNVWASVEQDMKGAGKTFADEDTTEEEARAEYRKISERRVRLGLVLAQIGDAAKVQISDDEVSRALIERARQFPGQEKAVWDFYRKNPQALAELRAPIFEEKVIDHILAGAKVTDKTVTREVLLADEEEDGAKPKKKTAKKKAD